MNERIRELADKIWAEEYWTNPNTDKLLPAQLNKFAELIIEDACRALNPMLRDMISRGQGQDLIRQHFNQRPGWICSKCGIDRTKNVCPKGHMAAVTGDCPMIGTAQTGVEE